MVHKDRIGRMPGCAVRPVRGNLIGSEMGRLSGEHINVMAENDEYIVLKARADQIPYTLHELGRLREKTFTGKREDRGKTSGIDHFDLYYIHFVIWSKKGREIVGGCRIGQADIILKRFGLSGLFTGAMFRYSPLFLHQIGPALEIGKVFVRREWRGRRSPASLLWRGVGRFISYNPRYKALISPTSTGFEYRPISRQLMVSFLKRNNCILRTAGPDGSVAEVGHAEPGMGMRTSKTRFKDVSLLSRLISEIEADGKGVPPDLRHCIKLGGTLIGFGPDPSREAAHCGLILLDLTKFNRNALRRIMGESGVERFFDYHDGSKDLAA